MLESLFSYFSPPILILIGAIVVAFCSAMNMSNRWLRYFALVGTMIVAGGTFWQAKHQDNYNTGGNSFAYFTPRTHMYTSTSEPPSYNDVELWLSHSGKYPLYDIQIRLVDIQKSNQVMAEHLKLPMPYDKLTAATETRDVIPRLDPGRTTTVFKLDLPADVNKRDFSVFFVARNGGWTQDSRFLRSKNGHWGLASRTMRKGEVLQEQGSQALPKDDSGKPKWD